MREAEGWFGVFLRRPEGDDYSSVFRGGGGGLGGNGSGGRGVGGAGADGDGFSGMELS